VIEIFQESFCRHFNVPPDRYTDEVLRRTLPRSARLLRFFLRLYDRDYFVADREFILGIGLLTRQGDFHAETQDFRYHPANRGFPRRALRLRVSANRMRQLISEVWPDFVARRARPNPSASPFPSSGEPPGPPTSTATGSPSPG
jgi:hypothetical protein